MPPSYEGIDESGVVYPRLRELALSGVTGVVGADLDCAERFRTGVADLGIGEILPRSDPGDCCVFIEGGSYRATASSERHLFGPGLVLLGLGRGIARAMASNSSTCFVEGSS